MNVSMDQVYQASIRARQYAYQWFRGAGLNNQDAKRQYDARLDGIQDMLKEIEAQVYGDSPTLQKLQEAAHELHSAVANRTFREEVIEPLRDNEQTEDNNEYPTT